MTQYARQAEATTATQFYEKLNELIKVDKSDFNLDENNYIDHEAFPNISHFSVLDEPVTNNYYPHVCDQALKHLMEGLEPHLDEWSRLDLCATVCGDNMEEAATAINVYWWNSKAHISVGLYVVTDICLRLHHPRDVWVLAARAFLFGDIDLCYLLAKSDNYRPICTMRAREVQMSYFNGKYTCYTCSHYDTTERSRSDTDSQVGESTDGEWVTAESKTATDARSAITAQANPVVSFIDRVYNWIVYNVGRYRDIQRDYPDELVRPPRKRKTGQTPPSVPVVPVALTPEGQASGQDPLERTIDAIFGSLEGQNDHVPVMGYDYVFDKPTSQFIASAMINKVVAGQLTTPHEISAWLRSLGQETMGDLDARAIARRLRAIGEIPEGQFNVMGWAVDSILTHPTITGFVETFDQAMTELKSTSKTTQRAVTTISMSVCAAAFVIALTVYIAANRVKAVQVGPAVVTGPEIVAQANTVFEEFTKSTKATTQIFERMYRRAQRYIPTLDLDSAFKFINAGVGDVDETATFLSYLVKAAEYVLDTAYQWGIIQERIDFSWTLPHKFLAFKERLDKVRDVVELEHKNPPGFDYSSTLHDARQLRAELEYTHGKKADLTLVEWIKLLTKYINRLVALGAHDPSARLPPVVIQLYAIPGQGKSVATPMLGYTAARMTIAPELTRDEWNQRMANYLYVVNPQQDHYDGHRGQPIWWCDDVDNINDPQIRVKEQTALLRLANTCPYNLPMASLEDKALHEEARPVVVIRTSNFPVPAPHTILERGAILRRLDICAVVRLNGDAPKDTIDIDRWTFHLYDPMLVEKDAQAINNLGEGLDWKHFAQVIKAKYEEKLAIHKSVQDAYAQVDKTMAFGQADIVPERLLDMLTLDELLAADLTLPEGVTDTTPAPYDKALFDTSVKKIHDATTRLSLTPLQRQQLINKAYKDAIESELAKIKKTREKTTWQKTIEQLGQWKFMLAVLIPLVGAVAVWKWRPSSAGAAEHSSALGQSNPLPGVKFKHRQAPLKFKPTGGFVKNDEPNALVGQFDFDEATGEFKARGGPSTKDGQASTADANAKDIVRAVNANAVTFVTNDGRTLNAVGLAGPYAVTFKHIWHALKVEMSMKNISYVRIKGERQSIEDVRPTFRTTVGADCVLLHFDLKGFAFRDVAKFLKTRDDIKAMRHRTRFPVVLSNVIDDTHAGDFGRATAPITYKVQQEDGNYLVTEPIAYHMVTHNYDCAFPVFVVDVYEGHRKWFGLHCAYSKGDTLGYAQPLYAEDVYAALVEFGGVAVGQALLDQTTQPTVSLGPYKTGNRRTKSNIRPTVFVPTDTPYAPARQGRAVIDGVVVDPLRAALGRMSSTTQCVYDEEVAVQARDWLIKDWMHMPLATRLTKQEAIFGVPGVLEPIDFTKGPGDPWQQRGLTRERLINRETGELHPEFDAAIDSCLSGTGGKPIFLDFLKDEVLKKSKVESGQSRMISGAPLHYIIACRMIMGTLLARIADDAVNLGFAAGLDPVSNADDIAIRLNALWCIDLDIKAFDFSQITSLMRLVNSVIVSRVPVGDQDLAAALLEASLNALHANDNELFQVFKSLASGDFFTMVKNTLYVRLVFAMFFIICGLTYMHWRTQFYMIGLGDDNTHGITDELERTGHLNLERFGQYMRSLGLEFTTANKEPLDANVKRQRGVHGLEFLKRRFIWSDEYNRWTMPLNEDSIFKSFWKRGNKTDEDHFDEVIHGVLREISIHPVGARDRMINKLKDLVVQSGLDVTFLTDVSHYTSAILNRPVDGVEFLGEIKQPKVGQMDPLGSTSILDPVSNPNQGPGDTGTDDIVQFEVEGGTEEVTQPTGTRYNTTAVSVDNTIANYFSRKQRTYSGVLTSASGAGTIIHSAVYPSSLMNLQRNINRVAGVYGWNCDVVVKVLVNAAPFQGGILGACLVPQSKHWQPTIALQSPNLTQLSCAGVNGTINFGAGETELTLRVPWCSPYNFQRNRWTGGAPVSQPLGGYVDDTCSFGLFVVSPVAVAAGQPNTVDVSVYVGLENFTPLGAAIGQCDTTAELSWTDRVALAFEMSFDSPLGQAKVRVGSTKAEMKEANGAISGGLRVVASASRTLSAIPILAGVTEPAAFVLDAIAGIASYFGWSAPRNPEPLQPMSIFNRYGMSTSDGVKTYQNLCLFENGGIGGDPTIEPSATDTMSVKSIVMRPAWLTSFNWATTDALGTSLYTGSSSTVDPANWYVQETFTAESVFTFPPVAYLTRMAGFWRGDVEYTFAIAATKFHSGRLVFVYVPYQTQAGIAGTPTIDNTAFLPRVICDIRDGATCKLRIPYTGNTFARPTYAPLSATGVIYAFVLNPLIATAQVTSSVVVNVFVAGADNFSIHGLTQRYVDQPFATANASAYWPVVGQADLGASTTNPIDTGRLLSDEIISVRSLFKKMEPFFNISYTPANAGQSLLFNPAVVPIPAKTSADAFSASCFIPGVWSKLAPMFAYWRGGVRILATTDRDNVMWQYPSIVNQTGTTTNSSPCVESAVYKINSHWYVTSGANERSLEVNCPYYNMRAHAYLDLQAVTPGVGTFPGAYNALNSETNSNYAMFMYGDTSTTFTRLFRAGADDFELGGWLTVPRCTSRDALYGAPSSKLF